MKNIKAFDEYFSKEVNEASRWKGKEIYPNNLRDWFISLYQILFGSDSGPRLGSFFKVYGKEKVLTLLKATIN